MPLERLRAKLYRMTTLPEDDYTEPPLPEYMTIREYVAHLGYRYDWRELRAAENLTRARCYAEGRFLSLATARRVTDGVEYLANTYPVNVMCFVVHPNLIAERLTFEQQRDDEASASPEAIAYQDERAAKRAASKAAGAAPKPERKEKPAKLDLVASATRDPDYCTSGEYIKRERVALGARTAWTVSTSYARSASRLCRERGIAPRTEPRSKRGQTKNVKVYPIAILREVHAELG